MVKTGTEYYENPSGSLLKGHTNYHHLFKQTENDFFNKRHKSINHNEGQLAPEYKKTFQKGRDKLTILSKNMRGVIEGFELRAKKRIANLGTVQMRARFNPG